MKTFAGRVIEFNRNLAFNLELPRGIKAMNPFSENPEILPITEAFYTKYYNDNRRRKLILGINPGRFGAGVTGIPFTDTKRLTDVCGIPILTAKSHEPSSVFVYELIDKYGGPVKFYRDCYINSMSPLGFIEKNPKGNWVNRNYYDYPELFRALREYIIRNLETQVSFGIDRDTCFVLGRKNAKYFEMINDEAGFFKKIVVFDHPRFIVQYRLRQKEKYLAGFLEELR